MTLQRIPRVAAIHDLSGFGRCSLSVIMPIMSAMQVQVCPVPTAVLSTHTGGLGEVEFRDLTDFIIPCLEHYKKLELDFEAVYSGFLGSAAQIDHCMSFFKSYPEALIVVDPVMGDNGKTYRTYTSEMCKRMKELVSVADIITPNPTEACLLLDKDYSLMPFSVNECRSMLARLSELGPRCVVITGIELINRGTVNVGYDREAGTFWYSPCQYVPAVYPGTGDTFTAVLTAAYLTGDSLPMAIGRATHFIEMAAKTTFGYSTDTRHGIMFEKTLELLIRRETLGNYSLL